MNTRLWLAGLVGAVACGSAAGGPTTPTLRPVVVFAFDQTLDAVIRMEDLNRDGDFHDPGEVTRFFDDTVPVTGVENAQGIVAIGPREVLATDNFAPDNVIRMRDDNLDGDAFDAGEASVFFSGDIGDGLSIANPAELQPSPFGGFYLHDNNDVTGAELNHEAIYYLEDLNDDGDVDDAGELIILREVGEPGVVPPAILSIVPAPDGTLYAYDFSSTPGDNIQRISPNGATQNTFIDEVAFANFTNFAFFLSGFELAYDDDPGRLITAPVDGQFRSALFALNDANGSGTINNASELQLLFYEFNHPDGINVGSPRDIVWVDEDDTCVFCDAGQDQIVRLRDTNGDGDFLDAGETSVVYSAAIAGPAGLISAQNLLSLSVWVLCPGDVTTTGVGSGDDGYGSADGATDLADLLYFVAVWQADLGNPSPNGSSLADTTTTGAGEGQAGYGMRDGNVDIADLLFFVNQWEACFGK